MLSPQLRPRWQRQRGQRQCGGVARVASRATVQTKPLSLPTDTASVTSQKQSSNWSIREVRQEDDDTSDVKVADSYLGSGPMKTLREVFLPAGYPDSVTPDYLQYQLWSVPTHIAGWLSHSLATSTLLKAVGISAGPLGTATASAAIKWVAKDGIGAAGRLLVGSRLGQEFDDDPRRWRMLAESISTVGLALDVSTSIWPQHFLLLASLGNFAMAIGKGLGKPAFRVISTHFAAQANVGSVAAKEEVWEVAAQLTGYALTVMLLQLLEDTASYSNLALLWASAQATHVCFRYRALRCLAFPDISRKRACMLALAHVQGRPLPSVPDLNSREPIWRPASALPPYMHVGCTLEEAFPTSSSDSSSSGGSSSSNGNGSNGSSSREVQGGGPAPAGVARSSSSSSSSGASSSVTGSGSGSSSQHALLQACCKLYRHERYLLAWRDGTAHIVLKQGSGARDLMRAVWQSAWLEVNQHNWSPPSTASPPFPSSSSAPQGGSGTAAAAPSSSSSSRLDPQGAAQLSLLQASMAALEGRYGGFEAEAAALGWKLDVCHIQAGPTRVVVDRHVVGDPSAN